MTDHAAAAEAFRDRHHADRILRLPNVWDAASAVVVERAGAPAIATSSIGIAAAHGLASGRSLTRDDMLAAVARIASAVERPVSADLEHGYGDTPDAVAATITGAIEAGAVGVNLEDGARGDGPPLRATGDHAAIVEAARDAAADEGVPVVVNARTDVFWLDVGDDADRVSAAVERGNAYLDAGADCVFVPGVTDADRIAALVRGLDGPLNVLGGHGAPPIPELEDVGVARVTVGAGPMRAALNRLDDVARDLLGPGTYDRMDAGMTFGDFVALLEG